MCWHLSQDAGSDMAHTMKIPEPKEPECMAAVLAHLAAHPPKPVDPVEQNRLSGLIGSSKLHRRPVAVSIFSLGPGDAKDR